MDLIICGIAFLASLAGAICGIGGGVIIKPLLDMLNIASVAEISFLSGCTVLSMSCYSVVRSFLARESTVRLRTVTPLAIGSAMGGILGKSLFSVLQKHVSQPDRVGGYQAICLAVITIVTLLYTLQKKHIPTLRIQNRGACIAIGLVLGGLSSFLGIGGGPINLMFLAFFFSMDSKEAAQNSLYIILISQLANLLTTVLTDRVPPVHGGWLLLMVGGGITGAMAGRIFNRKLSVRKVDILFIVMLSVIIIMSVYNILQFL